MCENMPTFITMQVVDAPGTYGSTVRWHDVWVILSDLFLDDFLSLLTLLLRK